MPDGDENTVGGDLMRHRLGVRQARARHSQRIIRAQHFIDFTVPHHVNLVMGKQALLQNFFIRRLSRR